MKAALVTPILSQLPFHPSCYLGYGAAVLQSRYDVDVIDLNAEMHFKQRGQLEQVLHRINEARVVTDDLFLYPFYDQQESLTDRAYSAVAWREYSAVYVTAPSWFPTVSTEAVLRLAGAEMDMVMAAEASVEAVAQNFLAGNYRLEPEVFQN